MNRHICGMIPTLISTVALIGCVKPTTSDDGTNTLGTGASGVTIYDIQQGNVEEDTLVTIDGVLVSTPINLEGSGFFIQDPAGGEYSGVYVFLQGTFTDLNISVGDEVSVTGTFTEYYDFTEVTVTSTEGIQVTGEGTVTPTPVSNVTDWEPWEGVLIELSDQEVDACIDSYGEVGLSAGIEMDDGIYVYDTESGATYSAIVGAVTYNFEEYKVLPRGPEDLQGYTAGESCLTTITAINSENIEGTVELEDVVVTSGLTDEGDGFFIQDQGGGAYSGIYVFLSMKDTSWFNLSVGDTIDVRGDALEWYDLTELKVSSQDAVTVTGSADPVAEVLTSAPVDWEPYEGALVTWTDVGITSSVDDYGECDTDYGISMDDLFYDFHLSSGDTVESVTGLITYSWEEYKLCPRDAADLGGKGTGTGTGPAPTATTVAEVQQGTGASEGDTVTLSGLIATSDADEGGFFVQDAGGGVYSGLYIYTPSGAEDVSTGDEVTVTGEVDEYYELTEVVASSVSVTGTGTPTATELTTGPADWEPYEGVLLTVRGLTLTSEPDKHGVCETDWTDLYVQETYYAITDDHDVGTELRSVTGPLTYSYSQYRLLPRSAADVRQ